MTIADLNLITYIKHDAIKAYTSPSTCLKVCWTRTLIVSYWKALPCGGNIADIGIRSFGPQFQGGSVNGSIKCWYEAESKWRMDIFLIFLHNTDIASSINCTHCWGYWMWMWQDNHDTYRKDHACQNINVYMYWCIYCFCLLIYKSVPCVAEAPS